MTISPMDADPVFWMPKNSDLICRDCTSRNAEDYVAGTCRAFPNGKPLSVFREESCPKHDSEAAR